MSRKSSRVLVLAHYQASDCRIGSHVQKAIASFLVNRLVCERISQSVIRMFAPDAVFAVVKYCPEVQRYIPITMPPAEVEDVKFEAPPDNPASTVPRMHNLPRFREVYGEKQLETSLAR